MTAKSLLYLSGKDVAAVGPAMAEIIAALATAFREKGDGKVPTLAWLSTTWRWRR